jgi:uroporphyrinogen decarboxylase
MKPFLVRHLEGEKLGRFPVWMMRQAGRYLPSYQAIRKEHSFWEMVTEPRLAVEVSLLPLDVLPVDGVIFFSDILTLPYGQGVKVEMKESVGPVIPAPLCDEKAFALFERFDPAQHTPFVGEAMSSIVQKIRPEVALLGFAGAPWTVGCYLIEGKANRHYAEIKGWMHRDPASLARSLRTLGQATLKYLLFQARHGASVVQLFDTWLSEMPRAFFVEHYVPILNQIFQGLASAAIPAIYFSKHAQHLWPDFGKIQVPTLSIDELVSLPEAERRLDGRFGLQGNLDPCLLLAEPALVRRETRRLVAEARELKRPAILNLGHGILPGASVEAAKAFVEEARALWI